MLRFKKEAYLFDSKLYILKTFLSVFTSYLITSNHPFIRLDMISVLFGLMLTLEPVTLTGIRSGISQVYASILGAVSTGIIITLFGINMFTIALSVSFTLYVCLKINWREVSPVAIFTSIYMTQYVQRTAAGIPSQLLTLKLRILALSTGVLIAIFYNFIFSLFSYKKMKFKRVSFIFEEIIRHMQRVKEGLVYNDLNIISDEKTKLPETFNNIDWLFSLFSDMEKENKLKRKILRGLNNNDLEFFKDTVVYLRNITHLIYDINYCLINEKWSLSLGDRAELVKYYENAENELKQIHLYFDKAGDFFIKFNKEYFREMIKDENIEKNAYERVLNNIKEIYKNTGYIKEQIKK